MAERPSRRWWRSLAPRALALAHRTKRPRPAQPLDLHVKATLDWLLYAHSIGDDGGLPAFYDLLDDSWAPSYPETSGYIIPTLLAYARQNADQTLRQRALEMAHYLLGIQTAAGAIPGWVPGAPEYVFDTGQVLFGWLAALQETGDLSFQSALLRAADWLLAQQEIGGYWSRYQFGGHVKTWDAHVAWPLLWVGAALERPAYIQAGRRCLDWVLTHQEANGWFHLSALEPGQPPVTHTIAYTVEALLESGLLLPEPRYVRAAQRTADALLARQRPDGSLSAYWIPGWQAQSRATCLTGDAQMALCWLRLGQHTKDPRYSQAGDKALAFVASTQHLDGRWPPTRGAIAGSWPLWGRYLRWRYPNWAAKFFLDAAALQRTIRNDP